MTSEGFEQLCEAIADLEYALFFHFVKSTLNLQTLLISRQLVLRGLDAAGWASSFRLCFYFVYF